MNVNKVLTRDYENKSNWALFENKANTNPIQTQTKPISNQVHLATENIGWINLDPKFGGVINDGTGLLSGYAWGENVGWIHLASSTPVAYKVQTAWITSCVVDFDDLGRFCDLWLQTGPGLKADFDGSNDVDFMDYCAVADKWLELCPIGWSLKD